VVRLHPPHHLVRHVHRPIHVALGGEYRADRYAIAAGDSGTPPHWSVTFGVDDADATAAKVRQLGGEVVKGPFDAPWTRMVLVRDPQGATFLAAQFVPENKDMATQDSSMFTGS